MIDPFKYFATQILEEAEKEGRIYGYPVPEFYTKKFIAACIKRQPNCSCCGVKYRIEKRSGTLQQLVLEIPVLIRVNPTLPHAVRNTALICKGCAAVKRRYLAEDLYRVADWMKNWGQTKIVARS